MRNTSIEDKEYLINRDSNVLLNTFRFNIRRSSTSNNEISGLYNDKIMASLVSVSDAIRAVTITKEFRNFVKDNKDVWAAFGTTDSHILRTKLIGLMNKAGLREMERFAVYFFCARVKDKDRILQGMELLPEEVKEKDWFKNVKNFFNMYTVKWPKLETAANFATLHLPNTNPGFDLLATAMMFHEDDNEDIMKLLNSKLTLGQLHLNSEVQAEHKEHAREFWTNTVKGSKNPMAKETKIERDRGFIEEYYDTSAGDKYPLVKLTDGGTPEEVSIPSGGYSKKDLIKWYKTVRAMMI